MTQQESGAVEAAQDRLFRAWLEDLRTVRAHADMRTHGHAILVQLLIGAAAVGGTILTAAGADELRKVPDLLLLVPLLSVAGASLYLDLSSSVYSAELYIQRAARQGMEAFLPVLGPPPEDRQELWSFELIAESHRGSPELKVVGTLKLVAAFLVPVIAALVGFSLLRPPCEWQWYEKLGLISDALLVLATMGAAWAIHWRRGRRLESLNLSTPPRRPEPEKVSE
jgi:hypothetical protein